MTSLDIDSLFEHKVKDTETFPQDICWTPEQGWLELDRLRHKRKRMIYQWSAMAASVLVLLGVGLSYFYYSPYKKPDFYIVVTGENEKTLVDVNGNQVWLNKNSYIMYPSSFTDKKTDIYLEGDAYFDFSNNSKKGIQIITRNTIIKAERTAFYIKQNANKTISISTIKGIVTVLNKDSMAMPKMQVAQGNSLDVIHEQAIFLSENKDQNILAWVTGVLHFTNAPLPEVFAKLDELYGTQTQLDAARLFNICLTRNYSNETIETIISDIQQRTKLTITKNGRLVSVSNNARL